MSFSQKVKQLLKENGMTKAELAKKSGIPYTTLDSMLKRETDTARLATIFRIANALDTSVEALVMEEQTETQLVSQEEKRLLRLYALLDSRGKNTVLSLLEKEADNSRVPTVSIPLYESPAAAGTGLPVFSDAKEDLRAPEGELPKGADFAVRIAGDSMEPLFSDGDLAYVKKCSEIPVGEIGIFVLNGESLCKQLTKGEDGNTYLRSLNIRYEPILILESDELHLAGRVLVQ